MERVHGSKLWWIVSLLCVSLLLSSLESTIVSTSLVSIASDFNNYEQSNWVVIVYLLTYSSFLIVFARLSDITGRKPALLTSLCFFTFASLACGLAQSLTQLIAFRVFQGVGGSGIYALTMVIVAEITPIKHLAAVSGMVNVVFVVASAIGPLIGGAITTYSSWRWCFYLNVPSGAIIICLIVVLFPSATREREIPLKDSLRRIDWLGLTLCLGASIIIILPIQEGGDQWAWNSAPLIVMFVVGALCWVGFVSWETWISLRPSKHLLLPMVPNRVVYRRVIGTCILTMFFTGISFTSIVVYLPQRFQAVNNASPVQAGIKILPILLVSAFGATISGVIVSKRNICSHLIIMANILQLIGMGLLSSLPTTASIPAMTYGYQAVLGLGLGTTLSTAFILVKIEVPRKDIAPAVGTVTQIRVFGGVIGLVVCRVIQYSYLRDYLSGSVTPDVVRMVMSSIASIGQLPQAEALAVRKAYGETFNLQWRILTYISAANVVVALFTFRRHAKSIDDSEAPLAKETEQVAPVRSDASVEDGIHQTVELAEVESAK